MFSIQQLHLDSSSLQAPDSFQSCPFRLETALRAVVLCEWNVINTANLAMSGFVPEATRSSPFRVAGAAAGSSGCGVS
jgi:hypothetical protein